ncbi:hypothetical protein QBZ16_003611 [Prototheca wickerhamii]|uniref:SET domain-containing protein n=1 Tax=Prototheca wickerhamii TaxID=3111 RepID=A0AAD9IHX9_PROWI|nr:hypothetical protein QBZ16_003611 [Prototheca wickerhamii]
MARTSSPNTKQQAPARKAPEPMPYIAKAAQDLPWTETYGGKTIGRMAVADTDLEAGTLVLEEEAVVTFVRTSAADRVCHACLSSMPPRPAAKEGEDKPDPALPRYCGEACARACAVRDAALLPLREAMRRISAECRVDYEMLALVTLLEFAGAGLPVQRSARAPGAAGPFPLRPSAGDAAALPGVWEARPAEWRKLVGAALRALHKELAALAAAGSVRAYREASALPALQRRAAMLATHLTGLGPAAEAGLGLFPGLAQFSHSCAPNCVWFAAEGRVHVRTTGPVPAGTPLTVSLVSLHEPRRARQQALALDRGIHCVCSRCTEPIERSTDRFLEGAWCLDCRRDVLILAADQAEAKAEHEAQAAAAAAQPAPKHKGAKGGQKGGKGSGNGAAKAAKGQPASAQTDASAPAPADSHAEHSHHHHHADGSCCDHDHGAPAEPTWWKCCGCGAVVPGVAGVGLGPEELSHRAALLWQQGIMLHNVKVDSWAFQQAEQVLRILAGGLSGRLHPLHARVIDAITPLLNISIQRGDSVAVFNLALQLWEAERAVVDLPTLSQLTYLSALVDAAQYKATHANSSVVRKQFDRKFKLAQSELVFLKKLMLGTDGSSGKDATFTASRVF